MRGLCRPAFLSEILHLQGKKDNAETTREREVRDVLLESLGEERLKPLEAIKPLARISNLDGQIDIAVDGRTPRSIATWSWRDGTGGKHYVTLPRDSCSAEALSEYNEELNPLGIEVACTGRESHMWDGSTFPRFLNSVGSQNYRRKRIELQLKLKDRGLLLFDACSSHKDKAYRKEHGP